MFYVFKETGKDRTLLMSYTWYTVYLIVSGRTEPEFLNLYWPQTSIPRNQLFERNKFRRGIDSRGIEKEASKQSSFRARLVDKKLIPALKINDVADSILSYLVPTYFQESIPPP